MDGRMVVEVFGRGPARYVMYYPKSITFILPSYPMSLTAELPATYFIALEIGNMELN